MNRFRFAAVISHPIQHYSPIFRELAKHPNVDVKVFYLCDHGVRISYDPGFETSFAWDIPLTEGHDHEFLRPGFTPKTFGFWEMDAASIGAKLDDFKPDLIWLHGYGQRICWRAQHWALNNNCKVIYFGDSELLHIRSRLSKALKKVVLPYFFSRCDAFITIGDNNENYYRHYGVDESKFYRAACPIEVDRFSVDAKTKAAWRDEVRARYGIESDDIVVLFSGKMQAYKRPLDLVKALRHVNISGLHLLFVGDGILRNEIVKEAECAHLAKRVHMTGFVNQKEIPKYLAAADVMVVSSERDAHPLVVSEALPFSLPIIASDKVGCVGPTDTARSGVNALVYPCGDIESLAVAMNRLAIDQDLRERFGEASRQIAPTQDISVTVDAILSIGAKIVKF